MFIQSGQTANDSSWWEWEFCFNALSKKDFFRIKFKQKSNNSVMEFYAIKNR